MSIINSANSGATSEARESLKRSNTLREQTKKEQQPKQTTSASAQSIQAKPSSIKREAPKVRREGRRELIDGIIEQSHKQTYKHSERVNHTLYIYSVKIVSYNKHYVK